MKLLISLIVLYSNAHAYKVIIQYESSNKSLAQRLSSDFSRDYKLPNSLMKITRVKRCDQLKKNKKYMILCLDKKKELVIINSSSQIIKTLNVFKRL